MLSTKPDTELDAPSHMVGEEKCLLKIAPWLPHVRHGSDTPTLTHIHKLNKYNFKSLRNFIHDVVHDNLKRNQFLLTWKVGVFERCTLKLNYKIYVSV